MWQVSAELYADTGGSSFERYAHAKRLSACACSRFCSCEILKIQPATKEFDNPAVVRAELQLSDQKISSENVRETLPIVGGDRGWKTFHLNVQLIELMHITAI
jgi:hypothetical protein